MSVALAGVPTSLEAATPNGVNPVAVPPIPVTSVLPPTPEPADFNTNPKPVNVTHLEVKLSQRRVYVYQGDLVKTSFAIAVGRAGWKTPLGTYKVFNKYTNPAWKNPLTGEVMPPGSENPLGERWIGFWTNGRNQIGFHGTPKYNEHLIGQAVSHGCIRMRNQDVKVLFELVTEGTPVIVSP
ncbi:L,D-transpeptidase [Neosynechococcus sphagnicola]|uniref:L,D-transpeptidase n=1 Tax=Neosynechococcus sphagnicola TaxID=1501145 RepID=UPI001EF9E642|nr:L,D-transpeptidase [Neosynechococcus sphagnicola]